MSTTTLKSVAGEACASIAKHYSDPIHCASSSAEGRNDDHGDVTDHHNVVANDCPYFATTLDSQSLPELAPVCGFWYKRLLESTASTSSSNDTRTSLDAARELLCCYESIIHPLVQRRRSSPEEYDIHARINKPQKKEEIETPVNVVVEVLRNYELLLAHLMRDASAQKSTHHVEEVVEIENECNSRLIEVISDNNDREVYTEYGISYKISAEIVSDIERMVHIIADDIFQWSTKLPKKKDSTALWKVQNLLLPCLLRLIEHSVVILTLYKRHNGRLSLSNTQQEIQKVLAIATITAVPFVGDGRLNSGVFGIGSLLDWVLKRINEDDSSSMSSQLSLAYTLRCSPSPVSSGGKECNAKLIPTTIMSSDFMTRPVVDWSVPSAHFDAPWVSTY